jgi:hypothetical protein
MMYEVSGSYRKENRCGEDPLRMKQRPLRERKQPKKHNSLA